MATADPTLDQDYAEHIANYRSFVRGVRYSVAAIAAVVIGLYVFLA
ncbi:aa3-type cytochrome c oxidase subunit IV [uncultured Hyphomicrobium sp.]|nr:aa3-type cytochrome c oxidase subunit IV [uncultured Hyphomicrobium sp.]